MNSGNPSVLAERLIGGDRRALAKAITLIESSRDDHRAEAEAVLESVMPHTGNAIRVGISGVPGVGKSTFIESFGGHVTEEGHRIAVLAVDPSSKRSGGSILGDKTRMELLSRNENAFIRPSPAGETLGGVARRTREAMLLCEAAGFDVILVETVGVGQSETAVAEMTDLFLLLLLPGGGDELQGLKKGIVEIADMILVNKADGALEDQARRSAAEYHGALRLLHTKGSQWTVPVDTCSALTGKGISEAWEKIREFRETMTQSGALDTRRAAQAREWLWSEVAAGLTYRLREHPRIAPLVPETERDVSEGKRPATVAARKLIRAFMGEAEPKA